MRPDAGPRRYGPTHARTHPIPSPRPKQRPVSHPSPSGPTLRANPFPEVTDLTCRLPLPTLFYRLEAVHLGDRMRIWVRTGVKVIILPLDFQVPDQRSADAARNAALFGIKTLSPNDPVHKALDPLTRKDNSSRPSSRKSPGLVLALRLGENAKEITQPPQPGSGMSTGFPFASPRRAPTSAYTLYMADVSGGGFRLRLRIDSPMCKCCSHGTLLHVSPRGSHSSICYYHQDLCQRRLQVGSRPDPSMHTATPSYSLKCTGSGNTNTTSTAEYRPDARAPSIFRAGCFGR